MAMDTKFVMCSIYGILVLQSHYLVMSASLLQWYSWPTNMPEQKRLIGRCLAVLTTT